MRQSKMNSRLHSGMVHREAKFLLALITSALAACSQKCDLTSLDAGWRESSENRSLARTLDVVEEACPAVPSALLQAEAATEIEKLHDVLSCQGSEMPMETTGAAASLIAREALWEECKASRIPSLPERAFIWASGRPDVALALHGYLLGQGAGADLSFEIASSALAKAMLPLDDDFEPLRLGSGAVMTMTPSVGRLGQVEGGRVAVAIDDTLANVRSALAGKSKITLVGLSASGDTFVERPIFTAAEPRVVEEGAVSLWFDEGKGISLFHGSEMLFIDKACPGYSTCWPADFSLAGSHLAAILPGDAKSAPVRVGVLGGDLQLSQLESLLEPLPTAPDGAITLTALPEVGKVDYELNAMAHWLAGLPIGSSNFPSSLWNNDIWKKHKAWLDSRFSSYEDRHLAQIRAWTPKHLRESTSRPLFYPFSGPDILNAVTFFPGRPLYVMGGLEALGTTPKAPKVIDAMVAEGLLALQQSLHNYLARNYFITWQMLATHDYKDYAKVGAHDFNGTTAIMLAFLARTGHDIISVRQVTLSEKGEVVAMGQLSAPPRGVQIKFVAASESKPNPNIEQALLYFSGDLSDRSLTSLRGFIPLIMKLEEVTTFLKAASYLMYNKSFDDMRSLILSRSGTVVTEDSGLPYAFIKRDPLIWDIDLYGEYNGPIDDFPERCQPDLYQDISVSSQGKLPFRYGYHPTQFHMMVARRKVKTATPFFDGHNNRGLDVFSPRTSAGCPTTGQPTMRLVE